VHAEGSWPIRSSSRSATRRNSQGKANSTLWTMCWTVQAARYMRERRFQSRTLPDAWRICSREAGCWCRNSDPAGADTAVLPDQSQHLVMTSQRNGTVAPSKSMITWSLGVSRPDDAQAARCRLISTCLGATVPSAETVITRCWIDQEGPRYPAPARVGVAAPTTSLTRANSPGVRKSSDWKPSLAHVSCRLTGPAHCP